ncbi:hypothetical protein SAMN05421823_12014 [Catalinimonas alkaloidigena]|uniref:Type 1 periplasmic binding fold superfamily protein n=1 Tax=Catalinimonas alkaloidigena TaxID=1075417 RepID=A0A1G9VEX7_9BACT|nr:hypothetical protein [Catalinimonas alkaloidigena]SDM70666.1 hypothetical protein SAMN05421823_12014 [Catalinimonas alkaloidigena]
MKPRFSFALLLLLSSTCLLQSCKKDDEPEPVNEEELITTFRLTFTEVGNSSNTFTATLSDPDGEGPTAPTVDEIMLDSATTYNVTAEFLNESDPNDVEDITEEIREEDDQHLLCFSPSGVDLTVNRTDSDGTYEVGLTSDWVAGAAGSGTITIALRHQPGVKDGTCDPGEADLEATFDVTIQ